MKKTIKEIGYILLLAVTSALLFNGVFQDDFPLLYEPIRFEAGRILTSKQALLLLKSSEVIFIDARSAEDYAAGHIRGAFSLPVHSSRGVKMAFISNYPKEQKMVVYCASADCPSAERLASEMGFMGYKNVMIYAGGWSAWLEAGYPVEVGGARE